jgi:hypothetical protein
LVIDDLTNKLVRNTSEAPKMHRAFFKCTATLLLMLTLGLGTGLAHAVCMEPGFDEKLASTSAVEPFRASNLPLSQVAAAQMPLSNGKSLGEPARLQVQIPVQGPVQVVVPSPRHTKALAPSVTGAESLRVSTVGPTARLAQDGAPPRTPGPGQLQLDPALRGEEADWRYGPLIATLVLMITIGVRRFRSGKS